MIKYILLTLLFCLGCELPSTPLKSWEIQLISPSGQVVEAYIVKSVDEPKKYYYRNYSTIYLYNKKPNQFESTFTETDIKAPVGWLIKIKPLQSGIKL
jgi:hypothetical protein